MRAVVAGNTKKEAIENLVKGDIENNTIENHGGFSEDDITSIKKIKLTNVDNMLCRSKI
jgi:DNA primase catalytic subunit